MRTKIYYIVMTLILSLPSSFAVAVEFGPGAKKTVRAESKAEVKSSLADTYNGPKFDLVVPVLDPGIPDDSTKWEGLGIWPELRRAEAVFYAERIAAVLADTGVFNTVMVVPDTAVSADLYLLGEIEKSNGEDLEIQFNFYDTTGNRIFKDYNLSGRVTAGKLASLRAKESDPYSSAYLALARKIVDELRKIDLKDQKIKIKNDKYIAKGKYKKVKPEALENIRMVRNALYAQEMSPDEFGDLLKEKKRISTLTYMPDFEQENWQRIDSILVADSRFNQVMHNNYQTFADNMHESYRLWQADAYPIAKAQRDAQSAANAALVGAIFSAAVAGSLAKNSNSTAGKVGAATAALASLGALNKSFKERDDSRQQAAQLNELGGSVSGMLAPKVIAMENREVELTGSASEQQAQWSTLLKELYAEGMQDFSDLEIVASTD